VLLQETHIVEVSRCISLFQPHLLPNHAQVDVEVDISSSLLIEVELVHLGVAVL
jgi:hypothetical protein